MIYLLDPDNPAAPFPAVEQAEEEPNGLLAVGGDLSVTRLLNAYRKGIFPWYSPGQPILWWSPDPRTVLFPGRVVVSRSLAKSIRNRGYTVSIDRNFPAVIEACSAPRLEEGGTWITDEMAAAYRRLHQAGHAHSVEVWQDGRLAGGLYGVTLGRIFFGESMFNRVRDASKVALVYLSELLLTWNFSLIDCQVYTSHLVRLGAEEIPRSRFTAILGGSVSESPADTAWDPVLSSPHSITFSAVNGFCHE